MHISAGVLLIKSCILVWLDVSLWHSEWTAYTGIHFVSSHLKGIAKIEEYVSDL